MSRYFCVCPTCGAHLDPGERCTDCLIEAAMLLTEGVTGHWKNGKAPCASTDQSEAQETQ